MYKIVKNVDDLAMKILYYKELSIPSNQGIDIFLNGVMLKPGSKLLSSIHWFPSDNVKILVFVRSFLVQPGVVYRPFLPSDYKLIELPFIIGSDNTYIDLLGRDDTVTQINSIITERVQLKQKFSPIIINARPGMGKTYLLSMMGLQKLKPE
ncbi:hypothetical protein HDU76_005149 [Blyttiomyces sp. JEL0837]|nr:hypothetical protein HDU76_005149 [Blyttiomyces sp. JEL0837]